MKTNLNNLPGFARGFTLVEMLVVITIIALLAAMMVPALNGVLRLVHTNASQTTVNQIDKAVTMYQADFSTTPGGDPSGLPPSNCISNPNGTTTTCFGCQSIVFFLTGYHMDANGDIAYGLKPNRNAQAYGPYYDTERIRVSSSESGTNTDSGALNDNEIYAIKDSSGTARPTFRDAFEKTITYYKCNNGIYNRADNSCSDRHALGEGGGIYYAIKQEVSGGYTYTDVREPQFGPVPDGGTSNAGTYSYIRTGSVNTGKLYRTDFMLMSWGGDGHWFAPEYLNMNRGYDQGWIDPPLSSIRDDSNNLTGR